MKQTIFETRQRAEELIREAVNIWKQSYQSDKLEGLEDDPVMALLMTGLAYQMNESSAELEQMKTEILQDFAQLLTPYEVGHAVPATTVVQTALLDNIPEIELDAKNEFKLAGTEYTFIPLLHTRVLNASVQNITRLDGRRWKLSLAFKSPTHDLSGFAFCLHGMNFRNVRLTVKGVPLPLAKPWNYSDLPLSSYFGLDTILHNRSQTYNASAACLDLFARQNCRYFCVKDHKLSRNFPVDTEKIDIVFEFSGISDDFVFDKSGITLNTVFLVNAEVHHVTLSSATPIVRVAGYDKSDAQPGQQFLHTVRPPEEQIYGDSLIDVRRVAGDRFNQGGLAKLLLALITKYNSDYYAFQELKGFSGDKSIQALRDIFSHMLEAVSKESTYNVPGVYLMLRPDNVIRKVHGSMEVTYLTTSGAGINTVLTDTSEFSVPSGFNAALTKQIVNPMQGADELRGEMAEASLTRYYIATNDRVVTPADMKIFCYNELLTRYGIVKEMVKNIRVKARLQQEARNSGYGIIVEIVLKENLFIKRSFVNKIPQVEILLRKMMEVRGTNIYPIQVLIRVEP